MSINTATDELNAPKVKVCSSIMGSGKSSAAMTYINEHPDDRIIYITPFLDEAARINNACPSARFVEPSKMIPAYHFRKGDHTAALIREGKNIVTTHQVFRNFLQDTLASVREQKYTLICDECVDVLENVDVHPEDMQMYVNSGYATEEDSVYKFGDQAYGGTALKELNGILRNRDLISVDNRDGDCLFCWQIPVDLFRSFQKVYILTYLFEGSNLCYFLRMHEIPFEYIGVRRDDTGIYRFCDGEGELPAYVSSLGELIHILDHKKLNAVGNSYYALSMRWYKKHPEGVTQLRKHTWNYFNHQRSEICAKKRLWSTYSAWQNAVAGKGYKKAFLEYNAKAKNNYRDRECLAYLVNPFMNVGHKQLFTNQGIDVNEDLYSLSVTLQWIWRSAIRDGKPIELYLPSKRMRNLLNDWIASVSAGRSFKIAA